jgi:hypothetical protein
MAIQVDCEHIRIPIDVIKFYMAQQRAIPISGQWSLTQASSPQPGVIYHALKLQQKG